MTNIEIVGIEKAITLAMKCKSEDDRPHPKVGAVLIKNNQIICEAYRGEKSPGDHAEYTALIKKCGDIDLSDATLIATLEPCTSRKHDKKPCSQHIVDKGIKKVIVGIIDPNPEIRGKGILFLQEKNVSVEFFSAEYQEKIREINKEFLNSEMKKYKIDLMKEGSETKIVEFNNSEMDNTLEIVQKMNVVENVTGVDAEQMTKGQVKVTQEIKEKAKDIIGAKIKRIG